MGIKNIFSKKIGNGIGNNNADKGRHPQKKHYVLFGKSPNGLDPPPCVFAEASDVTRIVNDMFIRPGVAGADLQTAL